MKRIIRVGTRESALAVTQTNWVIKEIHKKYPEIHFDIVKIKTQGDKILDTRLDKIGGKGLFIKELEQALLNGEIDIAVHSMKDMPTELPDGLSIEIVSKREDPRDVLVTLDNIGIDTLKQGGIVGTSSIRREVQLLDMRKDLQIKTLRGNVITRLNKLIDMDYDGIILAAAGLKRLELSQKHPVHFFDVEEMIPAVGQGVLCVETRKREDIDYLYNSIYCEDSALCIRAERSFMIKLNGGCSTPIAAHAVVEGTQLRLLGMIASDDMDRLFKGEIVGESSQAERLGRQLAEELLMKKLGSRE